MVHTGGTRHFHRSPKMPLFIGFLAPDGSMEESPSLSAISKRFEKAPKIGSYCTPEVSGVALGCSPRV